MSHTSSSGLFLTSTANYQCGLAMMGHLLGMDLPPAICSHFLFFRPPRRANIKDTMILTAPHNLFRANNGGMASKGKFLSLNDVLCSMRCSPFFMAYFLSPRGIIYLNHDDASVFAWHRAVLTRCRQHRSLSMSWHPIWLGHATTCRSLSWRSVAS